MVTTNRLSLKEYLDREYPFQVIADAEGGYVIVFPDLPGCMSQVETLDEVGPVAEEIRKLWIETAFDRDVEIPRPSYPEEYSGKFNLRLPPSLHRQLAEGAKREGVSLNLYVTALLARRDVEAGLERRLQEIELKLGHFESQLDAIQHHLPYRTANVAREAQQRVTLPSSSPKQGPVAA